MGDSKSAFESSVEYDLFTSTFGLELAGRYQLFNKLHESQISQIFSIKETGTDDFYILKAIDKSKTNYWDLETIKKIRHPRIARIVEAFSTEKYIYLVKEYAKGITLEEYIEKEGPINEEKAIDLGLQICGILKYLHANEPSPIIYRDLKPANLVLNEDGLVKLIDIDSVRQYKQDTKKDTVFIGTDGFAAPEQFGFGQTDIRTDIYTLGTTLYYLVSGLMPLTDKLRIKPVKEIRKDISGPLSRIIEKCTMFNPDSRYQSVHALQEDFLSLSKPTIKGLFRKTPAKVILALIIIGAITGLSLALNNQNLKAKEAVSPYEASQSSQPFSFDKTTILEAFWTGNLPHKLPIEFMEYYTKGDLYKYNPAVFLLSIREWDSSRDYEQMTDRIHAVGGKLILKADGYQDIEAELNSDSMTAGDGSAQVYLAYIKNVNDLISGVKYKITDTTGHWIVNDDVYVERTVMENKNINYDKTTINEAFWSGEAPKTLSRGFVEFYKQQNSSSFDPSLFFISVKEWDFEATNQMIDRINQIGGDLILRAEGYPDVNVHMDGSNITSNDGNGQVYLAHVKNEGDMVSGVRYNLADTSGHWMIDDGVYVLRPKK